MIFIAHGAIATEKERSYREFDTKILMPLRPPLISWAGPYVLVE
jgi:hypothetical protein